MRVRPQAVFCRRVCEAVCSSFSVRLCDSILSLPDHELRDERRAGDERVTERHLGADAHSVRLPGNRRGAQALSSRVSEKRK